MTTVLNLTPLTREQFYQLCVAMPATLLGESVLLGFSLEID